MPLLEAAVGDVGRMPVPMPPLGSTGPAPVAMPAYTAYAATTDLMDSPMDWSWEQLRDYVVRSVEERHGPQARDLIKETAIFKSFAARWGNQAGPIARFAFEQQDGFWRSAPVTVGRFTKGSDAYFAGPISERLAHV